MITAFNCFFSVDYCKIMLFSHVLHKPALKRPLCQVSACFLIYHRAFLWRHNGRDSVWNHQPHHCLPNRLFGSRSKQTSKLRVTGLCAGNSPETGEFPAPMASNAGNVSIWWRHHGAYKKLAYALPYVVQSEINSNDKPVGTPCNSVTASGWVVHWGSKTHIDVSKRGHLWFS